MKNIEKEREKKIEDCGGMKNKGKTRKKGIEACEE